VTDEGVKSVSDETPDRPVLRILNPDATPEEVAAIVTVFAGLGGGEPPKPEPQSVWGHHHYKHRVTYRRGPGAWVASGRPH
jgi:hypothetical protein